MDAVSPHTFIVDLEANDEFKPLPSQLKRKKYQGSVRLPDYYHKYEVEFYDMVNTCAQYIDKVSCPSDKLKFHKRLSKIFVIRHKGSVMSLFRELINYNATKGGEHGQSK